MSDDLKHYGVKGMKWGVRRYQPYSKGKKPKGAKVVGKAKEAARRVADAGRAHDARTEQRRQITSSQRKGDVKAIGKIAKTAVKDIAKAGREHDARTEAARLKEREHVKAKFNIIKEGAKGGPKALGLSLLEAGRLEDQRSIERVIDKGNGMKKDLKNISNVFVDAGKAFVHAGREHDRRTEERRNVGR